jgi:hypothetical protein
MLDESNIIFLHLVLDKRPLRLYITSVFNEDMLQLIKNG